MTTTIERDRYDVVVAGARVAGSATAMLLARAGARVLVVDPLPRGRDTLSTHALMRGGVLQLLRWGLLDALERAGTPPVVTTTFDYGEEKLTIPIKPKHGVDALYAPRRTVLDPLLEDAAVAAAAEVVRGWRVAELARDERGRVRGAWVQSPDRAVPDRGRPGGGRGRRALRRREVGGCAGRSRIPPRGGRDLRLLRRSGPRRVRLVVPAGDGGRPDPDERRSHLRLREPRSGAPESLGGRARAHRRPVRAWRGRHRGPVPRHVAERRPRCRRPAGRSAPGGRPAGVPGCARLSPSGFGAGMGAGGRRGLVPRSPTAHGLTDALRDAELLARAVLSGGGEGTLELESYQAARDAMATGLGEVTDRIAALDWSIEQVQELHHRLNRAMNAGVERLVSLGAAVADAARGVRAPGTGAAA